MLQSLRDVMPLLSSTALLICRLLLLRRSRIRLFSEGLSQFWSAIDRAVRKRRGEPASLDVRRQRGGRSTGGESRGQVTTR